MICFMDRTYCMNPNCTCDEYRRYTEEVQKDANGWWSRSGMRGDGPVAIADLCGEPWEEEDNEFREDYPGPDETSF